MIYGAVNKVQVKVNGDYVTMANTNTKWFDHTFKSKNKFSKGNLIQDSVWCFSAIKCVRHYVNNNVEYLLDETNNVCLL